MEVKSKISSARMNAEAAPSVPVEAAMVWNTAGEWWEGVVMSGLIKEHTHIQHRVLACQPPPPYREPFTRVVQKK